MKKTFLFVLSTFLLISIFISACSTAKVTPKGAPILTAVVTSTGATYEDPFAYCSAVGTIDTPDSSYIGKPVPTQVITGYLVAAGLKNSTEPFDMLEKSTTWRCMDGKVYACNFGANLPCTFKANTEKTPTQSMNEFCAATPGAENIPMNVTGHDTVYSWHCNDKTAEVVAQISQVDAAGFIADIWYTVDANAVLPTATTTAVTTGETGQLLFASKRNGDYFDLYLLDLSTSKVQRLTSGDSNIFPGPFSQDGSLFLFTGFGLTHSYVGVMAADGTNPVNLTDNDDVDEASPTWSPDGKQIAFTSRRDGNNEIYVEGVDGKNDKRLTDYIGDDFDPAWSPDGRTIAFSSDRDRSTGVYSIYLMNADGSNVRRLTGGMGSDYSPAWSPDGKSIAFRSDVNGTSNIYMINLDGSSLTELTNNAGNNWWPVWSPEGTRIAFQSDRDGNWEIYIMNADGSNQHNVSNDPADDEMPEWQKK